MDPLTLVALVLMLSILFSFLGMGGAVIYVPLFYWLGIDLITAIAMALMLQVVTTASASVTYLRKKTVDLPTAAPFILSSAIAAPLGAYVSTSVPEEFVLHTFSVVVAAAGVLMILSKDIGENDTASNLGVKERLAIGIISGMFIGGIAGLLGIGGGIFLVPILVFLGFGVRRAPATYALVVLFSSLFGFLSHISNAQIELHTLAVLGVVAFIGGQLGSHLMYL
ncbi:MAG: TSUP family transporter, partial [Methanococcoides sp.]|nr:TSUP family transporter [Methanococcoides sp.]